jgi:drug/metabolite transporter (DMT)-like permease
MPMNFSEIENPSNPGSSPGLGYIFSFTSAFFAACATVAGKWNLESISALLLIAMIFSIASLILSLTYIPFNNNFRKILRIKPIGWLWLLSFTGSSVVALWLFWAGIQKIDPSLGAFLNRTEVMVAILLGIIFLKERFNRIETLGAVLSIGGIIIMRLSLRVEYTTGFWLVLAGSFFFGATEFFSKLTVKHVPPIIAVYLRNLIMSIVYWIIMFGGGFSMEGLGKVWPGVVALAVFGPILSRMIYMMALKRLELSKVAVISQTQPVYVIILAFSVLGQLPTFREIIGGLFLLGGCLIMVLGRRAKKPVTALEPIQ